MEFARRRELRHPPSTNMRYSAGLYNVEGLKQDVQKPVIVPGMVDIRGILGSKMRLLRKIIK